jgi:hypothetical protein
MFLSQTHDGQEKAGRQERRPAEETGVGD